MIFLRFIDQNIRRLIIQMQRYNNSPSRMAQSMETHFRRSQMLVYYLPLQTARFDPRPIIVLTLYGEKIPLDHNSKLHSTGISTLVIT